MQFRLLTLHFWKQSKKHRECHFRLPSRESLKKTWLKQKQSRVELTISLSLYEKYILCKFCSSFFPSSVSILSIYLYILLLLFDLQIDTHFYIFSWKALSQYSFRSFNASRGKNIQTILGIFHYNFCPLQKKYLEGVKFTCGEYIIQNFDLLCNKFCE